ncbi:RICIN domain-containing protein [Catenulispora pinisilvae]|uniref:RICIN domain-containing protein n=1 Tax=Catenulispora pinisilvae TaxID=2705253 RepID=UPI001890DBB3|nr:hypothetical protein [Catenulispora pinisilvae]
MISKRRWAAIATGCALVVSLEASTASAATVSPHTTTSSGSCTAWFFLHTFDGQYLDARGTGLAQTLGYDGQMDEQWCFENAGNGFYRIHNAYLSGDYCLDDGQQYPNVLVYACDGNSQQQLWRVGTNPDANGFIQPSDHSGVGLSPRGDNYLVHLTAGNGWVWDRQ